MSQMMGIIKNVNYKSKGSAWQPVRLDAQTEVLMQVPYEHHEIHSGSHYYIQGYLELNTSDTHYVKLVTPDTTKWAHFLFNIRSSGITETWFYEGVSGGMAGGSEIVPKNNNRNSSNTSGIVLTSGVTIATDLGTTLENDKWGSEGFKEVAGGGGGRDDELILKQNTTYLRAFESFSDSNIIQFKASWYEHTDRN